MAIDRNDTDERQLRLDTMIEEFRAAQQRQLVKRERVQRNRAVAGQEAVACVMPPPPLKVQ
jgi:hypothetical protein